jgi:ribonuclease E
MSEPQGAGGPSAEEIPDRQETAAGPDGQSPPAPTGAKKRRRGSRGGRNRSRARTTTADGDARPDDLPDRPIEGRTQDPDALDRSLVRPARPPERRPQIGDSRPAPPATTSAAGGDKDAPASAAPSGDGTARRRRRRGGPAEYPPAAAGEGAGRPPTRAPRP